MKLYDGGRAPNPRRVRVFLAEKGITVPLEPVDLGGMGHQTPAFTAINPLQRLPALELDDGTVLTQSIAIIEYLEQIKPLPRLIPPDPVMAARVRAVALAVACDTHPLNNLRVLNYLKGPLGRDQAEVDAWYRYWVLEGGLQAIERMIPGSPFCFGGAPTLADVVLVPQVFNARRFGVSLDHLPKILVADAACAKLDAFAKAHPAQQPDAQ
jgi:maleylpyruvate isomerase